MVLSGSERSCDVVEVIAVVGVEQRAVGDRAGEVGRVAAARGIGHVDAPDAPLLVEPHRIVDHEVVALAGDHHVVVAVGPDLRGAAGPLGDERGDAGEQVALRLLAAEAAAHAPALDRHGVVGHAQHDRHHVLDLARVLGRGVDRDLVVLARDRQRDLALEVEVVLAADLDPALDPVRPPHRSRPPRRHAVSVSGSVTSFAVGRGRLDVEQRRQILVLDHRQARRAARLVARLGRRPRTTAARHTRPPWSRTGARRAGASGSRRSRPARPPRSAPARRRPRAAPARGRGA